MDVDDLWEYLEGLRGAERIPDGSFLHINALEWTSHLLQSPEGLQMTNKCGRSYITYDAFIRKSHHDLVKLGLKPIFYLLDSTSSYAHTATRNERDKKRIESWMLLHKNSGHSCDQTQLELPPLTIQQLVHSLNAVGSDVIRCQNIHFMALESVQRMIRYHPQFCYSDNT